MNVGLNLLFVIAFKWVCRSCLATMIAHFAAGVLVYYRVNKGGYGIRFNFGHEDRLGDSKADNEARVADRDPVDGNVAGSMIIQSFANRFGSTLLPRTALS